MLPAMIRAAHFAPPELQKLYCRTLAINITSLRDWESLILITMRKSRHH